MTLFEKLKNAKSEVEMARALHTYMCHWENEKSDKQVDLIIEYLKKDVGGIFAYEVDKLFGGK